MASRRMSSRLENEGDESWAKVHHRVSELEFDYTSIFPANVFTFLNNTAMSVKTHIGYLVPSLFSTILYVVSLNSDLQIGTGPGKKVKPNTYTVVIGKNLSISFNAVSTF